MSARDWVQAIGNGLTGIGAVVGAFLAWRGLRTWRHELRGRSDYHLARRILVNLYRVRRTIGRFRNELVFVDPKDFWDQMNELLSRIDTLLLEAEALWGDKLKDAKAALKACVSELQSACRRLAACDRDKSQKSQLGDAECERLDAIRWAQDAEGGEFRKKLEQAIAAFEEQLRPHLSK